MVVMVLAVCVQQGPNSSILPGVTRELREQSELTPNCSNFPENIFDGAHSIVDINGGNTPYLPLATGSDGTSERR